MRSPLKGMRAWEKGLPFSQPPLAITLAIRHRSGQRVISGESILTLSPKASRAAATSPGAPIWVAVAGFRGKSLVTSPLEP